MEDAFVVGAVGGLIIPYFYKAADCLNSRFSAVEQILRSFSLVANERSSKKKSSSEVVDTLANVYWDRVAFRRLGIYSFSKIS